MTPTPPTTLAELVAFGDQIRGIDLWVRPSPLNHFSPLFESAQSGIVRGLIARGVAKCIGAIRRDLDAPSMFHSNSDWCEVQLPEIYSERYTLEFARKFLGALEEVADALRTEWRGQQSIAHELALQLIIDEAAGESEDYEVSIPAESWEALIEQMLGDSDYEMLYDGILPAEEARQYLGMRDYAFERWFDLYPQDATGPLA